MIQLIARAIIPLEGKFLLVQNKGTDYWCLPGGNVEPHEPIVQALEREILEELGVRPQVGRLLYVQQLSRRADEERVEFFFLVNNPQDFASIDVATTTHGAVELADVGFRNLYQTKIHPAFLADELEALLAKAGPDVQFKVGS